MASSLCHSLVRSECKAAAPKFTGSQVHKVVRSKERVNLWNCELFEPQFNKLMNVPVSSDEPELK